MKTKTHVSTNRPFLAYAVLATSAIVPLATLVVFWHVVPASSVFFLGRFFQSWGPVVATWLITAPLVGGALFFIHRVTWWVFVGHSLFFLLATAVSCFVLPAYNLHTLSRPYYVVLVGTVALVAAIGPICRRDFRAPYFQRDRRGWRKSQRIALRHFVTINGREQRITNLSPDGCFVEERNAELDSSQEVTIEFKRRRFRLVCQGRIVAKRPDGYGIRFLSLPNTVRKDVSRAIRARSAPRWECHLPCTLQLDGTEKSGVLRDISNRGCFIQIPVSDDIGGKSGSLVVAGIRKPVHMHIVWSGISGRDTRQRGMGAKFTCASATAIHQLQVAAAIV